MTYIKTSRHNHSAIAADSSVHMIPCKDGNSNWYDVSNILNSGISQVCIENNRYGIIEAVDQISDLVNTYDIWNAPLSVTDSLASALVKANPSKFNDYYNTVVKRHRTCSGHYDPERRNISKIGHINSPKTADCDVLLADIFAYFNGDHVIPEPDCYYPAAVRLALLTAFILSFCGSLMIQVTAVSLSLFALGASTVTYAIENFMLGTVKKAIKENRQHKKGTHTVYVLIADKEHGGEVFYVGRTKNLSARYAAHKANREKRKYGGNFIIQAVYVGLNFISARALEQGLMNAFSIRRLINKIRAVAKINISPLLWTFAISGNVGNVTKNEWLYWIGR